MLAAAESAAAAAESDEFAEPERGFEAERRAACEGSAALAGVLDPLACGQASRDGLQSKAAAPLPLT